VLEGRLISVALQALRVGTSVVLDYGLWGRDERSALRWLARSAGAACQMVYLPVDKDVQLARIAHRQETAPNQTFPMTEADVDAWRRQFQVPDATELHGGEIPAPPASRVAELATVGSRPLALMHRQLIRTVFVVEPHRIPALVAGLVGLAATPPTRAHTSHYRRREAVPAQTARSTAGV
jgi:hypothetical protein